MQSPASVQRLRRFILDLAVRGKLIPQAPNDEPASELLKQIAKEKTRLVKAGENRKNRTKPVRMIETPFALPQSWKWASIGDIFLYDAGTKREPAKLNKSEWLLELEDVEKDTGRLLDRIHVSGRASKSTKSEFRVGDILYGKLRPYLNKVLVADKPGYSTTEIVSLRPYLPICSPYCALALRRPDFVAYVTRLGQGTKMPRLRTEDAIIAPFPLPPLAEQHRIVAKVDELMRLCDRLEAAQAERETTKTRLTAASLVRLNTPDPDQATFREHVAFTLENIAPLTTRPEQIKALRQTILNLAVRGKLVSQNPNDETASELLQRIAKEKARLVKAGEIKRPKKFPPIDEIPYSLPPSWHWTRIREITSDRGQRVPEAALTYIDVTSIDKKNGRVAGTKVLQANEAPSRARKVVQKGDVLYSCVRPYLLNVAIVDHDFDPKPIASTAFAILNGHGLVLPRYLWIVLRSPFMAARVEEDMRGQAYPAINDTDFSILPFPLPPLPEQRRIVAKVDELMALCDRLEGIQNVGDERRRRLFGALLNNAWKGQALARKLGD